jgi:hypothetical protein
MSGKGCATLAGLLVLAGTAGCQSKLKFEKTVQVDSGQQRSFPIDAPRYDQTVVVTLTADVPIDVYVYLEKNEAAAEKSMTFGKPSDVFLASKTNTKSETIDVKVPAKERAVITISGRNKPGTVSLSVVGK